MYNTNKTTNVKPPAAVVEDGQEQGSGGACFSKSGTEANARRAEVRKPQEGLTMGKTMLTRPKAVSAIVLKSGGASSANPMPMVGTKSKAGVCGKPMIWQ